LPNVIPAKAGIHADRSLTSWIPAFAGMTVPTWMSAFRTAASEFR